MSVPLSEQVEAVRPKPPKYLPTNHAAMVGDNEEAPPIEVQSWGGLFDERSEAINCDINDRTTGPHKCEFVNASLRWESEHHRREGVWSGWNLGADESDFHPQWGASGHGTIRFCRKCKHIDCLHVWEKSTKYAGPFAEDRSRIVSVISTCKICRRRIITNAYTDCSLCP